jgi:N6-adenosine-specific RNA methylase IME4
MPSIRSCQSGTNLDSDFDMDFILNTIMAPRSGHSKKPDNLHKLCEERFPGPYAEIFGRRLRENWTVFGHESPTDGQDIRVSLKNFLTEYQSYSTIGTPKASTEVRLNY